jgi:hypothetical protein
LEIDLPYSSAEAYARLQRVTAPRDLLGRADRAFDRLPLVGEVERTRFVVKPNVGYGNGFGALCRGELIDMPTGCRLRVQVGPPGWSLGFLVFWFGMVVYIGRDQLPAGAPWSALLSGPGSGQFLLMLGGGVMVATVGLGLAYSEAAQIRAALARALEVPVERLRGA